MKGGGKMSNMIELYSKEIKQELIKLEKKLKKVRIEAFLINNGRERIFEYLKNKKVQENLPRFIQLQRPSYLF